MQTLETQSNWSVQFEPLAQGVATQWCARLQLSPTLQLASPVHPSWQESSLEQKQSVGS